MRHQGPRLSSRARVCEVLAGGVLKEVCVLCWSVPPVYALAVGLRHLTRTVRKRDDGLMIALNDRRHHSDRVEQLWAGDVYLV